MRKSSQGWRLATFSLTFLVAAVSYSFSSFFGRSEWAPAAEEWMEGGSSSSDVSRPLTSNRVGLILV